MLHPPDNPTSANCGFYESEPLGPQRPVLGCGQLQAFFCCAFFWWQLPPPSLGTVRSPPFSWSPKRFQAILGWGPSGLNPKPLTPSPTPTHLWYFYSCIRVPNS